ncbi:MAG: hypothetical protein RL380_852 [Verrucomicrobiota bacterium]
MIGHEHPRAQVIPLRVMKPKSRFDDLCNIRPPQMTLALSAVEIFFQLQATGAHILNFEQSFPFGTQCDGKRISQMKSYKLRKPRLITVRQITAFVPPLKATPDIFAAGR